MASSEPSVKKKKYNTNTVTKTTFMKWDNSEDFDIEVDDDNLVTKVRCNICTEHMNVIRQEARTKGLRGNVLQGILNYVDGVDGAHKTNIIKHTKSGGLHQWAKQRFCSKGQSSSEGSFITSSTNNDEIERQKNQRSIEESTFKSPAVRDNYRRLFVTALHIAMTEKPLSDFSYLIDLQKKNGLRFFEGKTHDKACAEFISELANAMRNDLKEILISVNFFSLSMDGSQPRKTGHEKELLYTKVVIRGAAVALMLKCIHMDDFGSDAADLKRAVDETMTNEYISEEDYEIKLVCVCTDGASVNTGSYKGAVTNMKKTRTWLLDIHCSNHRLELAVQDAFNEDESFKKIDDLLLQMYLLTRNSGKVKRLLKATAMRLDVICVNFIKSSGTRFQNHKYRAIKSLIINYIPMSELMENYLKPGSKLGIPTVVAKMRGWLKMFRDFKCLASLHFYYKTLQQTAHLAYIMQRDDVMISDIKDALGDAAEKLRDLKREETELPFKAEYRDNGDIIIKPEATNLPATQRFKEKNKLSEKERARVEKSLTIHRKEFKVKNVDQGKRGLKSIKETLLPAITDHINCRFASFTGKIYESISRIIDHRRWNLSNPSDEDEFIKDAANHFSVPLEAKGLKLDHAVVEFKALKKIVAHRYHHLSPVAMWKSVMSKYYSNHPNIFLIIELILCLMWASSVVERGFNAATRLFVPSRRSLGKKTANDLLMLRINLPVLKKLDADYEKKLIEKAIDNYIPRKYHHTSSKASTAKSLQISIYSDDTEDLFLPEKNVAKNNDLLLDEDFLEVSESEHEYESELSSSDSVDDESTEESVRMRDDNEIELSSSDSDDNESADESVI